MANTITNHVAGAALLGTLLTACSDGDVEAAEDPEAEQELTKAREALANWSEMKLDDFRRSANHALEVTERRIASMRDKIANSEAADDARKALAELERQRDHLKRELGELSDETAEKFAAGKKAVAEGVTEFHARLKKAWDALAGN